MVRGRREFYIYLLTICVRDKAGVAQIPFRVNSGNFDVTVDAYLAPFAEVQFTISTSRLQFLVAPIPAWSEC